MSLDYLHSDLHDLVRLYVGPVVEVDGKLYTADEFVTMYKGGVLNVHVYGLLVLIDCARMFHCFRIETFTGDVKIVGDASYMFYNTPVRAIGDWDMSEVTNVASMFQDAIFFDQALHWNTSSITQMNKLFSGALRFNSPLNWDTGKVVCMNRMFYHAQSFDQPLVWNTANVNDMSFMFSHAYSFDQNLAWDTQNVLDMSAMFSHAVRFDSTLTFDTCNVVNMNSMFANAYKFNQPLNWDNYNIHSTKLMFHDAWSYSHIPHIKIKTDNIRNMFTNALLRRYPNVWEALLDFHDPFNKYEE
jgi:hypothetical protein